MNIKVLCSQQTINVHPGRILCKQCIEISPDFILHLLRREVGIHQVAEIKQFRVSPVSTIAALQQFHSFVFIRCENRLCDIQILNIINLIPSLSFQTFCFYNRLIQHGYYTKNLLIVFILTKSGLISIQKRHVMRFGEMPAEFV